VSDPSQVRTAVEATREFGGVDVMVNNAGVHLTESVLDIGPEQFDRLRAVNVRGCLFGCRAAARDMRERGVEGCILNMSSISATIAKPEQIGYESTKGASSGSVTPSRYAKNAFLRGVLASQRTGGDW
jgi:glucose 1-dehydrogenase